MKEAPGKPLRKLSMQLLWSLEYRDWKLILVSKEGRNCGLLWLRREGFGRTYLYFWSLWYKRAKCFLQARTDAKENSGTWVTINGPCPRGQSPFRNRWLQLKELGPDWAREYISAVREQSESLGNQNNLPSDTQRATESCDHCTN